jgi:hypothetical protein
MTVHSHVHSHLAITETLARLYLLLAQSMDRCVSEGGWSNDPEDELQAHLASTRAAVLDMLAGNRVVQAKVEEECNQVGSLVKACLMGGASREVALEELQAERAALKHKTMALTDLMAVFRTV